MVCNRCNTENVGGGFCRNCGNPVSGPTTWETPTTQPYQPTHNPQPYQQYPPQPQYGAWNPGGAPVQTAKRPINKAAIIGVAAAAVVIVIVLVIVLGGSGIPDGEYYCVYGYGATTIGTKFAIRGDKLLYNSSSYGYREEIPYRIEGNRLTIGVGYISLTYDFEMRGGSVFINGNEYIRR